MTEIMNTDSLRIVGIDPVPSYFQFYEGDKIIKIGRDCSLELGTGWSDHNEAATEFFNVVVGDVMPRWKQQERMEERAAIVAWLRRHKIGNFPYPIVETLEISSRQKALVDAIEAGEHLK